MSEPTIVRINFEANFTTLANMSAEDEYLTWQAKGLLWYLVSRPSTWKINRKHLAKVYKGENQANGATAIDRMFDELMERGYIIYRKQDPETGKMVHKYTVYPVPFPVFQKMIPKPDNPGLDYPSMVKPAPIVNNDSLVKNESSKQVPEIDAAAASLDIDPEDQRRFEPSPDSNPFKPQPSISSEARAELQKVGLSDSDIDNMASHNPEITDEQWIRTAHHSLKRKGDKNPGWYVRCAQEEWYSEESTETVKDANRERLRAKYHSLDSKELCNYRIIVGIDYIEFSCGQMYKSFTLTEKDVEAKLDKWLEMMKIKDQFYKAIDGTLEN